MRKMGSSILVCPMCCNETFGSLRELKEHLVKMTNNLYCPSCSEKYDTVAGLIQHLENCEAGNNLTFEENVGDLRAEDSEVLMDTNVEQIHESFLASVNNEGIMIVGGPRALEMDEDGQIKVVQKMETEDDIEESILPGDEYEVLDNITENTSPKSTPSKSETCDTPVISIPETSSSLIFQDESTDFLDEDQSLIEMNQDETKELGEDDLMKIDASALYSCSSCGMGFNSVLDHIKQFHDGQEVVLEMAEETAAADDIPEIPEEPPEPVAKNKRQKMNTIKTEECIDSEGRLYTRKVVQIEPFWDRKQSKSTAKPLLSKSTANPPLSKSTADPPPITLQTEENRTSNAPTIEKIFCNRSVLTKEKPPAALPKAYRCNQCLQYFPRLTDFRTHACQNGSHHCDHCDQSFATIKALQLHTKVHEEFQDANQFVCTICGTQFSSHKSLRLHSRMHAPVRERHVDAPEGDSDESFTCLECGKSFSESYRSAHLALHAGDAVTCTICNRKFDSADSLAMHAAVHPELGDSPLVLTERAAKKSKKSKGKKSDDPDSKEDISSTNENNSEEILKPYQCQHCGRRFTRPHEKVKHERIHTGEKPHACEVCGKTFRVSYCLTLHMRTHTGVRPYECKHCGKRFKASSVYNHHLLTHGDERAYKCPYCVKTFKTRVQLAGHKNSHTKPFRCTECSRPFASLYAARAHIATHKKDNNLKFMCFICGASYGRAFALNDHMKVHESQALCPPEPANEEIILGDFVLEVQSEQELAEEISPDL